MKKFKAETYTILMVIVTVVVPTVFLLLATCVVYANSKPQTQIVQHCAGCEELEIAIDAVLEVIYEDNPDYYLDVLCETEEFCRLQDILCEIPDSTKKKLKKVFPDEPSIQAP